MSELEPSDRQRRELVRRIYAADEDLGDVAGVLGVDLIELGELADEKFTAALTVLRALSDFRNDQFLKRYKINAIARLVELCRDENKELARRACVDLLRADMRRGVRRRRKLSVTMEQEEAVDQEQVVELLRKIGSGSAEDREAASGGEKDEA